MNSLSLKAAALVLLGASQRAWGQVIECGPSSDFDCVCGASSAGFDFEVMPVEGFTIYWSMDTAAETISFQVVSEAEAWTSIGFSSDGQMIGSDAVIGVSGEEPSVLEYDLPSKDPDEVLPFAEQEQEISDATVSQDGGSTTVTFTRPLVPTGAKQPISSVPGEQTIIIMAIGPDNELGYHGPESRGAITLDLFCGGDGSMTVTPPPAATNSSMAPSASPSANGTTEVGATPAPIAGTAAPTLADSAAPSFMTGAPTPAPLAPGETVAPTMMELGMTPAPADMATPAPAADADRGIGGGEDTAAPSAGGVLVTASPSALDESLVDGDGQDTDGASSVAGGRWAAAAVAGVVAVLAVLSL